MNLMIFHLVALVNLFAFIECRMYNRFGSADFQPSIELCPRPLLKNGMVRIRNKGKLISYTCNGGYLPIGDRYSSCIRGKWDTATPICIKSGCNRLEVPSNAIIYYEYNKAAAKLFCSSGYATAGALATYCDGTKWDRPLGICRETGLNTTTWCDFETPDLCGWQNDPIHDFDFKRSDGIVSLKTLKTGPKHDHTTMTALAGHFLIVDSYAQLTNETARLISPPFPATYSSPRACFSLWYHMYGDSVGKLKVYIKPASMTWDDIKNNPKYIHFEISGNQKNLWHEGYFSIQEMQEEFQIIVEATMGLTYKSDIAVDDFRLGRGGDACQAIATDDDYDIITTTVADDDDIITVESCEKRCFQAPTNLSSNNTNIAQCECHLQCVDSKTCCPDFNERCILSSVSPFDSEDIGTEVPSSITSTLTTISSSTKQIITSTTVAITAPTITSTTKPTTTTPKPTTTTPKPTTTTPKPTATIKLTTTPKPTTTAMTKTTTLMTTTTTTTQQPVTTKPTTSKTTTPRITTTTKPTIKLTTTPRTTKRTTTSRKQITTSTVKIKSSTPKSTTPFFKPTTILETTPSNPPATTQTIQKTTTKTVETVIPLKGEINQDSDTVLIPIGIVLLILFILIASGVVFRRQIFYFIEEVHRFYKHYVRKNKTKSRRREEAKYLIEIEDCVEIS